MKTIESPVSIKTAGSVGPLRRAVLDSAGGIVHADAGQAGLGTFTWSSLPTGGVDGSLAATGTAGVLHMFNTGGVFRMIGSGAIAIGATVYAAAAGKVSATGMIPVGIARTACLGDGDDFDVYVAPRSDTLLYSNRVASSAVNTTNAATKFDLKPTIPAGLLRDGDELEINFQALVASVNSTPTLATRLLIGSTPLVLGSLAAASVLANGGSFGRFKGNVRKNAGTYSLNGWFEGATGAAGSTMLGSPINLATFDPAVDNEVAVEVTWSASHASNSCALQALSMNLRRPA